MRQSASDKGQYEIVTEMICSVTEMVINLVTEMMFILQGKQQRL